MISVYKLIERDGPLCWICGETTMAMFTDQRWAPRGGRWAPTRDHIIPLSRGGTNSAGNLKLAHSRCNSIRGNELNPQAKMPARKRYTFSVTLITKPTMVKIRVMEKVTTITKGKNGFHMHSQKI